MWEQKWSSGWCGDRTGDVVHVGTELVRLMLCGRTGQVVAVRNELVKLIVWGQNWSSL
jgi:hypothetical protein